MALPELMLPSSLPDFKADDFVITPEDMYAPVGRQIGQPRKRRLFTSVPRLVDASLEVSQAGLETFFGWYEGALLASANSFTARVAKIGAGVEYWEAFVLSYTAEHREGTNNHIITMKLRLRGTPSDSPPTPTSLATEFSAGLIAYLVTPDYMLTAEFSAGLELSETNGPSLAAEFIAHLYTEANGPQSGNPLDAEFLVHLEAYSGDLPSAALAVEFTAALEANAITDNPVAVEFAAGLELSYSTTGYISNPGAASVSGIFLGSRTNTASAQIEVRPDGTIYKRAVPTGAYVLHANWYAPTLAGVGSGLWVRYTVNTGATPSGDSTGVALSLSTIRLWNLSASYGQVKAGTGTIQIATDPDMVNVISSFTVSLDAENTP